MENTKNEKFFTVYEFFTAYEELLAKLEKCKNNHELAIATREVQMFEMEYQELIEEYYHEKKYDYNE